ncbi:hypothetical protein N9R79_00915 [Vibrio sp.]|nr:hypothetical protein [Vibrio sp.]
MERLITTKASILTFMLIYLSGFAIYWLVPSNGFTVIVNLLLINAILIIALLEKDWRVSLLFSALLLVRSHFRSVWDFDFQLSLKNFYDLGFSIYALLSLYPLIDNIIDTLKNKPSIELMTFIPKKTCRHDNKASANE